MKRDRWRVAAAAAMTLWLAGWVPSIVFSWRVGGGPQFYAVWIILGPTALGCAAFIALGLGIFYQWALEKPSPEELQRRISELERELDIS